MQSQHYSNTKVIGQAQSPTSETGLKGARLNTSKKKAPFIHACNSSKEKRSRKLLYNIFQEMRDYVHCKLRSFNHICQHLGKSTISAQAVLLLSSHGKFGQNFAGGSIKATEMHLWEQNPNDYKIWRFKQNCSAAVNNLPIPLPGGGGGESQVFVSLHVKSTLLRHHMFSCCQIKVNRKHAHR